MRLLIEMRLLIVGLIEAFHVGRRPRGRERETERERKAVVKRASERERERKARERRRRLLRGLAQGLSVGNVCVCV